jgi:hypothetical protein
MSLQQLTRLAIAALHEARQKPPLAVMLATVAISAAGLLTALWLPALSQCRNGVVSRVRRRRADVPVRLTNNAS